MAKKKILFWLGEGVININGKDYGAAMPLPVDEINSPDLKKMIKDGRIGEMISAVVVDGRDNQIIELKSELAEMLTANKKEVKTLNAEIKELTDNADGDSAAEIIELKKSNVELDSEVKRLTGELEEATKPAEAAK